MDLCGHAMESNCTAAEHAGATTAPECSHSSPTPEAMYCEVCEMWLNGPTQWEDHLIGKKHRKNWKALAMAGKPGSLDTFTDDSNDSSDPEGHENIKCYTMGGDLMGEVVMPSDAKWQEIAVAVHLKFPAYQAIPPKHARFLTASQISEGINLARIQPPYQHE